MKVIKLAGLWKRKDKKGNLLLSGNLSDMSTVLIMKNPKKKAKNEPDFFLCIGPRNRKDDMLNAEDGFGGAGPKVIH